jgi:hypothetical protein
MGRLSQTFNMSPYHRSAIALKVNLLVAQQTPTRWLAADVFERWALDFLQMGNAYLEFVPNLAGRLAALAHSPAIHTRAGVEPGVFWWTNCARGKNMPMPPARCSSSSSPTWRRRSMACPNGSRRCRAGCSRKTPRCSAAATTSTARMRASCSM